MSSYLSRLVAKFYTGGVITRCQRKGKMFGSTNPYCRLLIGSTSYVSKTKKNTRNPRWEGESFTFANVNPGVESHIFFTVMHGRKMKLREDRKIGSLSVRCYARTLRRRNKSRIGTLGVSGGR
jgi:hypothetical protein